MTQVKLLGELGKKFGTDWSSSSKTVRDIFKLIDCQVDGLQDYLKDCHEKNIGFTIQNGEDFIEDANELVMPLLKDTVIITPVPAGSGKGLGKIIGSILLFSFMFYNPSMFMGDITSSKMVGSETITTLKKVGEGLNMAQAGLEGHTLNTLGSATALLGVNLALAGITEMVMPDAGKNTEDPSFLFNGAENNIEQGSPVPLLYGKMKIAGFPISQGFTPGRIVSNRGYYFIEGNVDLPASYTAGSTGSTSGTVGGGGGGSNGGGPGAINPGEFNQIE
tara:strand:+ start:34 stop:864 length:831 start_codon:yes stop_codon:yes gene_type:complete